MSKKVLIGATLLAASMSGSALANCWQECVLPNPISGGCGRYVRVCDVGDPGRAVASLTGDVQAASNRIVAGWHDAWGQVPQPIRSVLEQHPLAIIAIIYPETRAYFLAVAAIEEYASRAIRRAQESSHDVEGKPDWYQQYYVQAQVTMLMAEMLPVERARYTEELSPDLAKYDGPWGAFRGCMQQAAEEPQGNTCFKNFKRQVKRISLEDETFAPVFGGVK